MTANFDSTLVQTWINLANKKSINFLSNLFRVPVWDMEQSWQNQ